ncbi:MAG: hypothetical protein ABSH09_15335 [Bryobacteraceae bacterium]|jgi:hypothetical protein
MTLSKIFTTSAILALSLVSGHAQSGETVHVRIPFSFIAAGRELPAGDYVFEQSGEGGSWLIHGQGSSVGLLTSFGGSNASEATAAEFSVSAGHKYLDEIRLPDGTVRHVLYHATK